jgi:hypothetical protein
VPDVVPHDSKVARSVSPPASRGDVSSPLVTGMMRTVVFMFATHPRLSAPETVDETLFEYA